MVTCNGLTATKVAIDICTKSEMSVYCTLYIDTSCETECRVAMDKAAFNKKRALFTSTLDLELRKKLVKCYIWRTALYGADNSCSRSEIPRKF